MRSATHERESLQVGFLLLGAMLDAKRGIIVLGHQDVSLLLVYFGCYFLFPVLTLLDPWTVELDDVPLNVHRWSRGAHKRVTWDECADVVAERAVIDKLDSPS